jgi:hypothetical protein
VSNIFNSCRSVLISHKTVFLRFTGGMKMQNDLDLRVLSLYDLNLKPVANIANTWVVLLFKNQSRYQLHLWN